MKLPAPVIAVAVAALLLLIGTALLQATTSSSRSDPVASVDNGGPRGLLLLQLALSADRRVVVSHDGVALDDVVTDWAHALVLVPPPEQSAFSAAEVTRLRDLAARGARVVVGCDGNPARRKRLRALVDPTGLRCTALADGAKATASVDVDSVDGVRHLEVLDRGRVALDETHAGLLPLSNEDNEARVVVASAVVGHGEIVVLGSMSLWSNDGLVRADNAALLQVFVADRTTVVVDESHHQTRFDAVVARAKLQGPGPRTAAVCAVLLVVLALLSWAPRTGELVGRAGDDGDDGATSAADRVAGLAALLIQAAPRPTEKKTAPEPRDD